MGDLVGTCPVPAAPAAPTDPGVGQPGRSLEYIHGHLVVCPRSDATVHTVERILAEHGGVRPAHHLRTSADWPTCAHRGGDHHLAGGHSRWLECGSNWVRLGRQTKRAPDPRKTTPTRRLPQFPFNS